MLDEVMRHLRNYFIVPDGVHNGTYNIEGGEISLPFLSAGQYFKIEGSVFNDGVYRYPASGLIDEVFIGSVWALAVPKSFLQTVQDIETYVEKTGSVPSVYQSESFAGYSYSRAVNTQTGQAVTWKDVFRSRLNQWRKI